MKIKTIINGIGKYKTALYKLSNETGISKLYLLSDCLWAYVRYGCVLNHYIDGHFYLRKSFERKKIVTYRTWKQLLNYNDTSYIHILKNKTDFNNYFAKYIGRKWLDTTAINYHTYKTFLQTHNEIFVKPFDGWEGDGCRILTYNEESFSEKTFNTLVKSQCIIEEVVKQHHDMIFNNKAVNTIRAYTVYNNKISKAYCIKTVLRAGVGECIVDNSHSGGVTYQIDLATGRIISKGWQNGNATRHIIHPGTDICMLGYKIPFYFEAVDLCCKAASMIPQVRYIGWDIAITDTGPILIEGNHDPDIDVMEFVGEYGYKNIIMNHLK